MWQHRFDQYYEIGKYDVHLRQIFISTAIMALFTFFACGYVKQSVTRDFVLLAGGADRSRTRGARPTDLEGRGLTGGLEIVSDVAEHVGWQRIKDDVFRAPTEPTLLAASIGIGAQIALALFVSLIQMSLFYATTRARHIVFYASIVLLALCGFFNGFITSRTLKFFGIYQWKYAALIAALIFPCYVLFTLSFADIIESATGGTAAIPFSEGLWHYLLWWALDAPCAYYGAYLGFVKPLGLEPEVGPIKRSIPQMPWYLRRTAIVGLYGPLIFGSIFYEFGYLMDSIWRSYMLYAMFAILLVSLILMTVTIASLSVMVTYQLLRHQNYDWWWSSFSLGASGGLYMMLYSVYYMVRYEDMSFLSSDFIYFLTMTLVSACFAAMCGAIAVLSSYLFVERIYRASSKGQFVKF